MDNLNSIELNDQFTLAFRFVTETSENIFLTGKAGTGKTTLLKYIKEHCAKNIVVAAPTGVAAINAGGVTLHSLFQLPFHAFLPNKANKDELLKKVHFNKQRKQLLRKMELLVIDEISMVRADTLDAIDTLLRSVRRNHNTAFGGVQLLCIGDLFQLPPVAKNDEWNLLSEFYSSPFFFDSLVIKEQMPLMIELTKIYRQKEDSFVRLLNKVRNNNMDSDDFDDLHLRYNPGFQPLKEEKFITLTSHNNLADQINNREINKLFTKAFYYNAIVEGDFPEHVYPAEAELILKEGTQVMFLKNDIISKRYFNGKIGVVKALSEDDIVVESDGEDITVRKEIWENTRYKINGTDGRLEQEVLGTFEQFPLRLAWAITIHKSQGLTFDKVMIDAGLAFSSGQVYVALSRCTSLDGIVLLSKINPTAIKSNEQVVKGQQWLTPKCSLTERFEGARFIFIQQQLEQIFLFEQINSAFNLLLYHVKENSQKLNDEGISALLEQHNHFLNDKMVGEKFIGRIYSLLKEEPVVEKNMMMQKRMHDAANHFELKLKECLDAIKNNSIVTEHKDVANEIDEALNELALSIHCAAYQVQFCKQPFSLVSFLKHKLAFVQPKFNISTYAGRKNQNISGVNNPELLETLKRWRDMVFEETALPIYLIANVETLKILATYLPTNKKDLEKIKGFGKAKVEKFGDDIIELIVDYCEKNSLETNMQQYVSSVKKVAKEGPLKADTKKLSFDLFKAGKSIQEIAKERNFTPQTIEGHLSHYVLLGEISVNEIVSTEKQEKINTILINNRNASLTQLKELLPDISFSEIKFVLAALSYEENKPQV